MAETAVDMRDDTHMADAPGQPPAAATDVAAEAPDAALAAPALIAEQPHAIAALPAVPSSPPSAMHDATSPAPSALARSTSPVAASSAAATAASASASSSSAAAVDAVSQLSALERVFHAYWRRMQMTPAPLGAPPPLADPPPLTPDSLAAAFDSMQAQLDQGYLREDTLAARCAAAHREVAQFEPFLASTLSGLTQRHAHLRATFMDPGMDALLRKTQLEKQALQAEIQNLRDCALADGFIKDSVTGRKLLNRVHILTKENEEYYSASLRAPSVLATERALAAAQLELAPLKTQHAELLATYEEMEQYLADLETDNRALQTQLDQARTGANRAQQTTPPAAVAAAAAQPQQQAHAMHPHPQLHPALYFGAPATT